MPSTRTICYYAMYVIGEVESNWNWTSVYRNDPITIGIMQWYGTRAAALLNRLQSESPDDHAKLAQSTRDALAAHPSTDTWWNTHYLTDVEVDGIVAAFTSRESHLIQENQAINDFEGYITTLEGWGFSQSDPKPLIFAMAMYHQSPRSAGRVVQTAGGSATLDRLYQVCMNDGTLGKYKTRYNTVKARLDAWDGESEPPDFGQDGGAGSGGGDSGGIDEEAAALYYIIQQGDNLIAYGEPPYDKGLTFFKTQGQTWKAALNLQGTPITGGNTGGGSASAAQAAVDLYVSWVGKFAYSQGAGRLSPLTSGYGDCSSTIWYAYHEAMGIDVGTWTGAMATKGTLIASGTNTVAPIDIMVPGDLIIVWRGSSTSKHVEMYIGNNQLCGHGGPGNGPTIRDGADQYTTRNGYYEVRRYA